MSSTGAEAPLKEIRTWEHVNEDAAELVGKIRDDSEQSGQRYDGIVVFPKGGYHLGSLMPEALGFRNDQILHASLQSYDPELETAIAGGYIIGEMPPQELIEGKDLLAADEVWDRGLTMYMVMMYCRILGANMVKSAVLDYKPGKNQIIGYQPDFCVNKTNAWLHYPWEEERAKLRDGFNVVRESSPPRIIQPREWLRKIAEEHDKDPEPYLRHLPLAA